MGTNGWITSSNGSRNNALKHVGKTNEDTWWGVDYSGDYGIRRKKIGQPALYLVFSI